MQYSPFKQESPLNAVESIKTGDAIECSSPLKQYSPLNTVKQEMPLNAVQSIKKEMPLNAV